MSSNTCNRVYSDEQILFRGIRKTGVLYCFCEDFWGFYISVIFSSAMSFLSKHKRISSTSRLLQVPLSAIFCYNCVGMVDDVSMSVALPVFLLVGVGNQAVLWLMSQAQLQAG